MCMLMAGCGDPRLLPVLLWLLLAGVFRSASIPCLQPITTCCNLTASTASFPHHELMTDAHVAPAPPPPAPQLQSLNRRLVEQHAAQLKSMVPLADAKAAVHEAKQQGRRRAEEGSRKLSAKVAELQAGLAQQQGRVKELEAERELLQQELEGLRSKVGVGLLLGAVGAAGPWHLVPSPSSTIATADTVISATRDIALSQQHVLADECCGAVVLQSLPSLFLLLLPHAVCS